MGNFPVRYVWKKNSNEVSFQLHNLHQITRAELWGMGVGPNLSKNRWLVVTGRFLQHKKYLF